MNNPKPTVRNQFERIKDEKYGLRKWHCDDIWEDRSLPDCVFKYLDVARAAVVKSGDKQPPPLYATYKGKRVRIVMASQFGDVGITEILSDVCGYSKRIYLPEMTDFSDTP